MVVAVTPKFFEACKIPLVAGRDFRWSDTKDSPRVAILDETEAQHLFGPDVDVLGHRIAILEDTGAPKWTEIVGMVKHVVYQKADQQTKRGPIYFPVHQQPQPFMWMVVRTKSDPRAYEQLARSAVIAVNKDTSITDMQLLDGMVQAQEPWIVFPSWLRRQSISLEPQVTTKPTAKNTNWEVKIVSATRRAPEVSLSSIQPRKDTLVLLLEVGVEYVGPEKEMPASGYPTVTLNSKELFRLSTKSPIVDRETKKFTFTSSFEDPGPEPEGKPRQFFLKMADVPLIPFTLTEEKEKERRVTP
jgi:hypothetical protein